MRSPSQAGVGGQIPYLTPSDIVGAYVAIRGATWRQGRFGAEVVFTLELLADQFDQDGNAIPHIFRISQKEAPARLEYVSAFANDNEPIGPMVVVQLPAQSDDESGAIVFNDATDLIDMPFLEEGASRPKGSQRAVNQDRVNYTRSDLAPRGQVAGNRFVRKPTASRSAPPAWMGQGVADEPPPMRPDDDLEDLPY